MEPFAARSLVSELPIDMNPLGRGVTDDCNFVWPPSEAECMNTVEFTDQSHVFFSDLLVRSVRTFRWDNPPHSPSSVSYCHAINSLSVGN